MPKKLSCMFDLYFECLSINIQHKIFAKAELDLKEEILFQRFSAICIEK